MKVLYLHGWNSVVGGVKPTYLKSHGHDVHEPALDREDFQAALETAQAAFGQHPDSLELISKSDLPPSALIDIGQDHRLADPEPLEALLRAVAG